MKINHNFLDGKAKNFNISEEPSKKEIPEEKQIDNQFKMIKKKI